MTGDTSGAGIANFSGTAEFVPVFSTFCSGICIVNAVKLHVVTFLVSCCDVRCHFRLSLLPFVLLGFMFFVVCVYLRIPMSDTIR